MTSVTLLSDHACTLGEGPAYDAASDTAWWFDIIEKTLFEHRFGTGETLHHTLPFMASQLSFIDDGRQLVAAQDGLYIRDIGSGALSLLSSLEAGNAVTRSNDGRVHPSGALWISTMGKQAESGAGAIYRFFDGEISKLYERVTIPNAIAFSPDGTRGTFTDTAIGRIMTVALDPATGLPLGEPVAWNPQAGDEGSPDGAVFDADGVLWNARWGGARISAYRADGMLAESIALPASQPTCPVFVGRAFDRLLVTSARQGLSDEQLGKEPDAGKTFIAVPGVVGGPEPRVLLA